MLASRLGDKRFAEACSENPKRLLLNMETGDVPAFINLGYPWAEDFNFYLKPRKLRRPFVLLDDLLVACTGKTCEDVGYFEFVDLGTLYLADSYPDWRDSNALRTLVASIAMNSGIRAIQSAAFDPESPSIWLSTSEGGGEALGAVTRVL